MDYENKVVRYFLRVGLAASVLLNVILGGPSNQTFSARNWDRKRNKKTNLVKVIDTIIYVDDMHCMKAWINWCLIKEALTAKGYKFW